LQTDISEIILVLFWTVEFVLNVRIFDIRFAVYTLCCNYFGFVNIIVCVSVAYKVK